MSTYSTVSVENWVFFLDPLIDSWDIDLETFGVEIVLTGAWPSARPKRFEFVEKEPQQPIATEPGLEEFLRECSLSGDATEEEIEFLKMLKFTARRPTAMYYYREIQSLRDPLHFRDSSRSGESNDRGRRPGLLRLISQAFWNSP